jgi:hypothetical protein
MQHEIESKFLDFARARAVGDDVGVAVRSGRFSALPNQAAPDLFGSVDMLYAAHILGKLDEISDAAGRAAWLEHILSYQDEDGWFRSRDKQSHGVEHATAYALGGLQILAGQNGDMLARGMKPLRGLQSEIAREPGRSIAPFDLTLLDRVHFWRGSHRVGGLAAIVGTIDELGLSGERFLGIASPRDWLDGWWAYFAERVEAPTGYWTMAPLPLQMAFDTLYRFRHNPKLASMGGAVHLYWVSEKMRAPMPHPRALIPATIDLMEPTGLYENEPYCIDLDGNFLIGRALSYLEPDHELEATAREALAVNRDAVLTWFASRPHDAWKPNSHALPGALAAVAEADRTLMNGSPPRWRDIFETTWWL